MARITATRLSATAVTGALVDLAPGDHKPPYDWKHGYIPLTPAAALSKAKGSPQGAARLRREHNIAGMDAPQSERLAGEIKKHQARTARQAAKTAAVKKPTVVTARRSGKLAAQKDALERAETARQRYDRARDDQTRGRGSAAEVNAARAQLRRAQDQADRIAYAARKAKADQERQTSEAAAITKATDAAISHLGLTGEGAEDARTQIADAYKRGAPSITLETTAGKAAQITTAAGSTTAPATVGRMLVINPRGEANVGPGKHIASARAQDTRSEELRGGAGTTRGKMNISSDVTARKLNKERAARLDALGKMTEPAATPAAPSSSNQSGGKKWTQMRPDEFNRDAKTAQGGLFDVDRPEQGGLFEASPEVTGAAPSTPAAPNPSGKDFRSMSDAEKLDAARRMYGEGSEKHKQAEAKWGATKTPAPAPITAARAKPAAAGTPTRVRGNRDKMDLDGKRYTRTVNDKGGRQWIDPDGNAAPADVAQQLQLHAPDDSPAQTKRRQTAAATTLARQKLADQAGVGHTHPSTWPSEEKMRELAAAKTTPTPKATPAASDAPKVTAPRDPNGLGAGVTVEHTAEGTVIHGTRKDDTATTAALRAAGARWAPSKQAWVLPSNFKDETREQRVDQLERTLPGAEISRDGRRRTAAEREAARMQRAATRADRKTAQAEKLEAKSEADWNSARAVLDNVPLGQPWHNTSAGRAFKNGMVRQRRKMERAGQAAKDAESAREAAERAKHAATGDEAKSTTQNRIDKNEAEIRAIDRQLARGVSGERRAELNQHKATAQDRIDYDRDKLAAAEKAGKIKTYSKATVQPGDFVRIGSRWYAALRSNEKSVTVPSRGGGRTDTAPWSNVTGHKSAADMPVEQLEKLRDQATANAAKAEYGSDRQYHAMLAKGAELALARRRTDLAARELEHVVDLAPGDGRPPYDWRHGWIPVTPAAALSKAKGNTAAAAKIRRARRIEVTPDGGDKLTDELSRQMGRSGGKRAGAHERQLDALDRLDRIRAKKAPKVEDLGDGITLTRHPDGKTERHVKGRLVREDHPDGSATVHMIPGRPQHLTAEQVAKSKADQQERARQKAELDKQRAEEAAEAAREASAKQAAKDARKLGPTPRSMKYDALEAEFDSYTDRLADLTLAEFVRFEAIGDEIDRHDKAMAAAGDMSRGPVRMPVDVDLKLADKYLDQILRQQRKEERQAGKSVKELRGEYDLWAHGQYLAAEAATKGYWFTAGAPSHLRAEDVFDGAISPAQLSAYASRELRDFLEANPRMSFDEWRGVSKAHRGRTIGDEPTGRPRARRKSKTLPKRRALGRTPAQMREAAETAA